MARPTSKKTKKKSPVDLSSPALEERSTEVKDTSKMSPDQEAQYYVERMGSQFEALYAVAQSPRYDSMSKADALAWAKSQYGENKIICGTE